MLVEITGKNKWCNSIITAPDIGYASISLDGIETYTGRATADDFSFEITDAQHNAILTSSPKADSRWHAFLGHGNHVFKNTDGAEVARVIYHGPFGFQRTIAIASQRFPCPRRQQIGLPGATITLDARHRIARAEIFDSTHQFAYLGIAFYLWLREDTMST